MRQTVVPSWEGPSHHTHREWLHIAWMCSLNVTPLRPPPSPGAETHRPSPRTGRRGIGTKPTLEDEGVPSLPRDEPRAAGALSLPRAARVPSRPRGETIAWSA